MGAQLLERTTRGVTPTPAGRRLYLEARKLLAQAEQLEDLISDLTDEEAPIRLAASHTIAEFVLPQPLVEFEAASGRYRSVELVIANSTIVRSLVAEGRVHFGIAAVDPEPAPTSLEERPFCDDEVLLGVPPKHPWIKKKVVGLEEFVATPLITHDPGGNTRRIVDAALAERGLSLAPPLAGLGSTAAAIAAALSREVPVLLSALAFSAGGQSGLEPRSVSGLRFERRFVLVLGGEETLPAGARALATHLLDAAAQLPGPNP